MTESYCVEASEGLQGQFHSTDSSESVVVMGGKDGQWITITEKMNSNKPWDRKEGGQQPHDISSVSLLQRCYLPKLR